MSATSDSSKGPESTTREAEPVRSIARRTPTDLELEERSTGGRLRTWGQEQPDLAVAAGFLLFAAVGLVLSQIDRSVLQPARVGTLGEWAAAIGTVAAVAVALRAVAMERAHTRSLEEKTQELEEDARYEQAALVVLNVSTVVINDLDLDEWVARAVVSVDVFGDAPIRSVELVVKWPTEKHIGPGHPTLGIAPEPTFKEDGPVASIALTHLAPAEGYEKTFACVVESSAPTDPLVLIRWFDRWGTEWWAPSSGLPSKVPLGERRSKVNVGLSPSEWLTSTPST